jgi:hypothetical protein
MIAVLIAAAAAVFGMGAPANAQEARISCASEDYSRMICRIGRDVSEVRLVRQISQARCVLDRSWGVERGKLWVDQGCAAVFDVIHAADDRRPAPRPDPRPDPRSDPRADPRPDPRADPRSDLRPDPRAGQIQGVLCNSVGRGPATCAIARGATWARLARRTSDARCTLGESWRPRPGAIEVDRGCAGLFEMAFTIRAPQGLDWVEIATGRGVDGPDPRPDPRPAPRPDPRPDPRPGRDEDRADRIEERIAIRACRRHGEDQPRRLFDARWVEAGPASDFSGQRRGPDILVEGRYDVARRGPDETVTAICRVRGGRVTDFSVR